MVRSRVLLFTEETRKKTIEIERLRKAAEKDLSQTDVKSIQKRLHFCRGRARKV
jgi:hypothetical protein